MLLESGACVTHLLLFYIYAPAYLCDDSRKLEDAFNKITYLDILFKGHVWCNFIRTYIVDKNSS